MRRSVPEEDSSVDRVNPKGKWKFNGDVASSFSDMLQRSIPQYDVMRKAVFDLACRYSKPKTSIIALGCSRGDDLAPLIEKYGALNRFVGVEISDPMLEIAKKRFSLLIRAGVVSIEKMDLRREYPSDQSSITMSILCIQFIPIEYRQRIVKMIYDHLNPGGAAIIVEKVLGDSAELDESFVEVYLSMKKNNGYTKDQIERKKMSLEGVLVPVTAEWNEQLLRRAGFSSVDCFWRWFNFAGWIALK